MALSARPNHPPPVEPPPVLGVLSDEPSLKPNPQPPADRFRSGKGGFSTVSPCVAVLAILDRLSLISSPGFSLDKAYPSSPCQTTWMMPVRTKCHSSQVALRRSKHQPDLQRGYTLSLALAVAWLELPVVAVGAGLLTLNTYTEGNWLNDPASDGDARGD